jgi:hypothetical protein
VRFSNGILAVQRWKELITGIGGFNYSRVLLLRSSSSDLGQGVLPPCEPRISINGSFDYVFPPRGGYYTMWSWFDPETLKEQVVDKELRNSRIILGSP